MKIFFKILTLLCRAPTDHWCSRPLSKANISIESWKRIAIPKEVGKDGKEVYDKCNMYDLDFQKLLETHGNNVEAILGTCVLPYKATLPTVISIISKPKLILWRQHYGQITSQISLYNFYSCKNLKYFPSKITSKHRTAPSCQMLNYIQ